MALATPDYTPSGTRMQPWIPLRSSTQDLIGGVIAPDSCLLGVSRVPAEGHLATQEQRESYHIAFIWKRGDLL